MVQVNKWEEFMRKKEMEEKKTIIVLGSCHFREDLWQRAQQLTVQFQQMGYKTVYVNYRPGVIYTTGLVGELSEAMIRQLIKSYLNQTKKDEEIFVLDKIDFLQDSDGKKIWVQEFFLEELIRYFSTKDTKVISYYPQVSKALKKIKEENQIQIFYDCVDDMTGFHSKKVIQDEHDFIKIADGVIVTSKTLFVQKSREAEKCVLIPNGVNPEQFAGTFKKPNELKHLKGPIIGYVGAVHYWFDQDLVCELATHHPDWNIVLVGSIYTDVSKMKRMKNVYLLGKREYKEVPKYMKHFDVGIIPFSKSDLIVNTNPIKYFEYLASGIQTVATTMPELINEPYCYLGNNATDFSNFINKILINKTVEDTKEYLALHSWTSKAKEMVTFMERVGVYETKREEKLQDILKGYEHYHNIPLLSVLKAEIYDDLSDTEKAKSLIEDNLENVLDICLYTQIRLALKWGEQEYLNILIKQLEGLRGLLDNNHWTTLGLEPLTVHVYKLLGEYQKALNLGNCLCVQYPEMLEELGNIEYELGNFDKAIGHYFHCYYLQQKLHTLEGSLNYSQLASAYGNNALAGKLSIPYEDYLNHLLSSFISTYSLDKKECIKLGNEFLKNGLANGDVMADLHSMLALAYESIGNIEQAIIHASKTLEIDKQHKEANDILIRQKK